MLGKVEEIVITDLNNFSTHMIRYLIGDPVLAAEQSLCHCGRAHSQISKIYGRTQTLIYCTNGVSLAVILFAPFFKEFDFAIKHFQVYLENKNGFLLQLVTEVIFSDKLGEEVVGKLKRFAGDETNITVERVENIPLVITGKRTPVISKLQIDYQGFGHSLLKDDSSNLDLIPNLI